MTGRLHGYFIERVDSVFIPTVGLTDVEATKSNSASTKTLIVQKILFC